MVESRSRSLDFGPNEGGAGLVRAALGHPTRWALLVALGDESASAGELATILNVPVDQVRHHLRILEVEGAVRVCETRIRRNFEEHCYAPVHDLGVDNKGFEALAVDERRKLDYFILKTVLSEVGKALVSQEVTASHSDRMIRIPLKLDEQGWQEASELHMATVLSINKIRHEAQQRLTGGSVKPVVATSVQMLYRRSR